MTGYIDLAYYRDVYHGVNVNQPDINDKIMLANLIIGEEVNFVGLDKLTGSDTYNGIILQAADETKYKLDVDNLGILQTRLNGLQDGSIVASDGQKELLRRATCMEVDYLYAHPEAIEHYTGVSVSVGSFSISGDASSVNIPKIGVAINALLMYGGFLNRGVCVR